MTTIEEIDKKIKKIETDIEETKRELGITKGQNLLTSLYSNLAELRKEKNALLGQTGNDFVTEGECLKCITTCVGRRVE